jgi:S1-C subfamily serine protease
MHLSIGLMAISAIALGFSCAAQVSHVKAPAPGGGDFVGHGNSLETSDYRRAVAVVRPQRHAEMKRVLLAWSAWAEGEAARGNEALAGVSSIFQAHADGGFGSGFVVVVSAGGKRKAYLVTNRHVVEEAESVNLLFDDGRQYHDWRILFTDWDQDIAIATDGREQDSPFEWGLVPSYAATKDRDHVITVGFPALGNDPSYQTTEGTVSNCCLKDPQNIKATLIQHTAAIDPGSSGGPLIDGQGAVVGINTAIARGRSNVGLSIPSSAFVETLAQARQIEAHAHDPAWKKATLESAASRFAGEISSNRMDPVKLAHFVSNQLVAEEGASSFTIMARMTQDSRWAEMFPVDPVATMRMAVIARLAVELKVKGGAKRVHFAEVNAADLPIDDEGEVRTTFTVGDAPEEVGWKIEQGHWRLTQFNFESGLPRDE